MMLKLKSLCVCEISAVLGVSSATTSNHLSYLKSTGFIEDKKDGKWINYALIENPTSKLVCDIMQKLDEWFYDSEIISLDRELIQKVDRYIITAEKQ